MLGLYDGKVDGYYTDDFVSAVYNFQIQEGIVSNEYQPGAGSWGPATRQAFFVQYPQTSYRVFRSNDVISKSEAMKILMRMANIQATSPEELDYIDITTDWHIPYVRSGQTLGLFNPVKDDLEFNPNDGVTREDMVDLTYRLIQLYK